MHTLIICGSIAAVSHTRVLLRALEVAIIEIGEKALFWDLRESPLPPAEPEYHWKIEANPSEDVQRFAAAVRSAHSIAIGSPLYHGSFSGILKNALDQLWYDAFRDKPVALLSHGSSIRRCAQPCEHLQTVITTLYGRNIQTQVASTKSDFGVVDGQLHLREPEIIKRVSRQALELIFFAKSNQRFLAQDE